MSGGIAQGILLGYTEYLDTVEGKGSAMQRDNGDAMANGIALDVDSDLNQRMKSVVHHRPSLKGVEYTSRKPPRKPRALLQVRNVHYSRYI